MKALLVDDSLLSRKIQKIVLEEIGVTDILEASDGRDALVKLEASGYDVDIILTDWNMPSMDGLTFIRELRKREQARDLPVIVVSSEGDHNKVVYALRNGANSYVAKPFRKSVLARRVESVINVSRLPRKAGIAGDLSVLGFAELVQLMNYNKKSGVLHILPEGDPGGLGFVDGEILHAWLGDINGEQAFFAIARLNAGRFEFFEGETHDSRSIHGSTLSLLMEAMRMIDEAENSS